MSGEPSSPSPLAGEGGEPASRVRGDAALNETAEPPSHSASLTPHPVGSASQPPSPARGEGQRKTRRTLALGAALIAVALGVWYFAIYDPEPADDLGRFQGEWQLAVPAVDRDNKPAARAKPVTIRVTGDRWAYVADGKEQRRYALTLRPEATPKELDLTMLGPDGKPTAFVIRGVYEVGGGRAKVVTAPAPDPRPTSLDTDDGVWLLERVK